MSKIFRINWRTRRSTPDHIHNLENDFIRNFTLDNTKCAAPVFSSSTKEQFNDGGNNHLIWTNETNMPMEIDNPFNKKSEDCVDFVEDMDIDFDAECYANSSFSKLDNMLKNRKFNNDQVKDWMIKQIHLKNKSIDLKLQDQVLENILKGHEVKYKGLKGLHSKLSLELEQYKH
ncbi:hypothetical protein NQ318_002418 [Aromia moschata]|uniref:Uncharacterized protein n=1 Tax=Aromia moschata TaxID=1265417 RepID=A0AAV8YFP8_9CUCU|nr:hypothetical protein NQ318_002418 [Aromia moschata]